MPGHVGNFERPEQFNEAVRGFCRADPPALALKPAAASLGGAGLKSPCQRTCGPLDRRLRSRPLPHGSLDPPEQALIAAGSPLRGPVPTAPWRREGRFAGLVDGWASRPLPDQCRRVSAQARDAREGRPTEAPLGRTGCIRCIGRRRRVRAHDRSEREHRRYRIEAKAAVRRPAGSRASGRAGGLLLPGGSRSAAGGLRPTAPHCPIAWEAAECGRDRLLSEDGRRSGSGTRVASGPGRERRWGPLRRSLLSWESPLRPYHRAMAYSSGHARDPDPASVLDVVRGTTRSWEPDPRPYATADEEQLRSASGLDQRPPLCAAPASAGAAQEFGDQPVRVAGRLHVW